MIRIEKDVFCLETEHTGYYIGRRQGLAENLHYGRKIHIDPKALREKLGTGYGTDVVYQEETPYLSLLHLGLELSPCQKGDFRQGALEMETASWGRVWDFQLTEAKKVEKAEGPSGLPSAFGGEETLVLEFSTPQKIQVILYYTVFPDCDVITRRMAIKNNGKEEVRLERCMSYQLDLPKTGYCLTTFTGVWARERHETKQLLKQGSCSFGSRTGVSSHYCNPCFLVSEEGAGEWKGEVYGFNLIYSGSHFGQVETGPYGKTRIQAGIQPEGFSWTLSPGESFETPEGVLTWSDQGKNGMSQNMHRFIREHMVRGHWAKRERPVLFNNWEATYFDFKESKLLKLAREAKKLGIELFVLDDGWFGERDSDKKGLGDYQVNAKKLPGGLKGLADKLTSMGLLFGLWMEPEMVNPDSQLYRKHPEWAVQNPLYKPSLGRNQLVLDLCQKEVQDHIIRQVNATLKSAPISYVKWDMNRPLTDGYSPALKEQGRFFHAWMLGFYRVLEEVTKANPKVLFAGCASGGNRFDLGILCYMPQIWTSDNTDEYERLKIQTGTSCGYPQSVMGCHVSDVPNHQTLRSTPLESRFDAAAFGLLGYELDLGKLSMAEKKVMAGQIAFYKEHRRLLQYGTFLRLKSPFQDPEACVWMTVSVDQKEAILFEGMGRLTPNSEQEPLRLAGLNPDLEYEVTLRSQFLDIRSFGSLINQALPVKVKHQGMAVHLASDFYMLPCEQESFRAYGDLLMYAGIKQKPKFIGTGYNQEVRPMPDYSARIYYLKALK